MAFKVTKAPSSSSSKKATTSSSKSSSSKSSTGSNSLAMAQQAVSKGYVKSVADYNNAVTAGQSGAKYGYTKSGNTYTANNSSGRPITSEDLAQNSLIDLPQQDQVQDQMGTITANNLALGVALPTPNATNQNTETTSNAITGSPVANYLQTALGVAPPPAPESGADAYLAAQKELGIKKKQQAVSDYTAQLNAITSKAQADQLRVTGQGRGIPEAIIGGQQAQISKEAAIQALPIQAQLAAAQGNLEMANKTLDTYYQIKSQDIQNTFNYEMKLYDSVMNYIDKKEQNALDEKRQQAQFKQQRDMAYLDYDLAVKKASLNSEGDGAPKIYDLGNGQKGTYNATTGQFEPVKLSGSQSNASSLAQSQGNVKLISSITNDSALTGSVGPTFLTRSGGGSLDQLTGQKQNFLAGVQQLTSQLSLDSLIRAKQNGATFGALSEGELALLSDSATKLNTWAIKDKSGNVTGYRASEGTFRAELDKINNYAKIDYLLKGGNPEDVGVQVMPNGTYVTKNSDGTYSELK